MLGQVTMAIAAALFLLHPGGAVKKEVCDPGWTVLTSTCFKVFKEQMTWSEAQTHCEKENATLLSANSTPGLDRVKDEVTKQRSNQSSWWTGVFQKIDTNTSLVHYLNTKIFFLNATLWKNGEPNNRYAEDCAEMTENGKLNDVKCDKKLSYICLKFFTLAEDTTTKTEDCGEGWFLLHRACYKLSTDALPWEPALKNCEGDGGTLLSISSVAELNQIKKEIRKMNKQQNTWWVGLRRTSTHSIVWEWLDSASPFSPRVTKWNKLEPNNADGKENCVEITSDGSLNDKNCEEVRPFVCERHEITPRPRLDLTTESITTTSTTTPLTTTTITSTSTATTPAASTTSSTSAASSVKSSGSGTQDETPSSYLPSSSPSSSPSSPSSSSSSPSSSPSSSTTARAETPPSTEERTTTKTTPTRPTRPTSTTVPISRQAEESSVDLYKLYAGCYLLDTRGSGKDDDFLYQRGSNKCPPIAVSRISWPETDANVNRTEPCKTGQGRAFFYCGGTPVCWRGQPNTDECASPQFKKILEQIPTAQDPDEAPEPEQSVALTTELVEVTKGDDVTPDDVLVTSKVISNLVTSGAAKKMNETQAEAIVKNVLHAGSNLVSANKSRVWTEMSQQDKILSATSLMVAMETATVAMAEAIDKPVVIPIKDENIELELHVINVTSVLPEEIVYNAQDSENSFAIPLETLSHLSQGGLAKVVFMTHYTMGGILGDVTDDDNSNKHVDADDGKVSDDPTHTSSDVSAGGAADVPKKEKPAPKLASFILSASVGGQGAGRVKLPQPVTFTMKHLKKVPVGWQSLCSFWEINESKMGSWSQDGCRVVRSNASQTTCECDHMTNFAVLMAVQEVKISETHQSLLRLATIVGCVISCICLLASWITFTCFTSLQGERNSIHKNLVVCLFIAEMLFLTGIDQTQNRLACGFIAGFLHYFFLASFLWMLLEGVHIVLMLVQVFDASRSRLPYYYASAYAPPILIIAISAGLYHQGYGTERYCWLTTERYFIWSFAGPVAVILFVNAVILVYAMTMVCRHSEYVFSGKDKNSAGGIRSWIQGAAALEVLLGLTWILGYFFLNTQTLPLAYLFTALNSLQGLFIFCFHCLLNKKARKEYRRVMKVKRRPSTTTGSGTGTHSASLGHRHKHDLSLDSPGGPSFNSHSA